MSDYSKCSLYFVETHSQRPLTQVYSVDDKNFPIIKWAFTLELESSKKSDDSTTDAFSLIYPSSKLLMIS